MFISRKALAEILDRLDRLETIVASATGYDKAQVAAAIVTQRPRTGSRCQATRTGRHDFSGTIGEVVNGARAQRAFCQHCGQVLGA